MRVPVGLRKAHAGLLVAAAALVLPAFLWPESLSRILSTQEFLPHSYCYVGQAGVIWLNAGSDVIIGGSYLAIAATLAFLVHKARREIPYSWMIQAFGLFIVTCGLTHLMEVWTVWQPRYWLAGDLKLVTAVASLATAVALPMVVPEILRLVTDARLSGERKRQLEPMTRARGALQRELRSHDDDVSRLTDELIASKQALQRSHDELRSLGARFAGILEIAEDAVISVDARQRITLFNRAAEKIFGYAAQEVIGQPLEVLLPERLAASHGRHVEGFAASAGTARRMGELREVCGRRKDGSEFPAEASISKLNLGGEQAFIAFLRDVTEQRRAEAARQRAEDALAEAKAELARMARVTTMGELAASIAHEINQPLTAVVINGNACRRWLAAEPTNMQEANEALQRIIRDANRASDVITRIRGFLRRGEQRQTRLDVNEVIGEVIGLVQGEARTNGVSLQFEAAADLPVVVADRVQLQQVVLNLVMNAIEAMGSITGRARILEVWTEARDPDAVLVAVRDSGVGLDPEHRDRIFDAFYTTKSEGMGMGLAISRSIVEAHGGRLWATPNAGPGETFQFTLPIAGAGAP